MWGGGARAVGFTRPSSTRPSRVTLIFPKSKVSDVSVEVPSRDGFFFRTWRGCSSCFKSLLTKQPGSDVSVDVPCNHQTVI